MNLLNCVQLNTERMASNFLIANRFQVFGLIGSGSFGEIHVGINICYIRDLYRHRPKSGHKTCISLIYFRKKKIVNIRKLFMNLN